MTRSVPSPCTVWWVCWACCWYRSPTTASSFSGQIDRCCSPSSVGSLVTSLIVWGILKAVMGIRVSEEDEYEGVDMSECGMEAYPEFVGAAGSGN